MTDEQVFARTKEVIATEVDGELVLLHTQNWNYYAFDSTGMAIWALLETPSTLPALVQALTERYTVDEAQCREDTKMFLQQMIKEGVIVAP